MRIYAKRQKSLLQQGTWVPYNLKPRDVERRFFACEQLFQRQKRKGFLHRIVMGTEKWIHYSSPKRRKLRGVPGHASTSSTRPNIHAAKVILCIWWDQVGVIYYELLKLNETITEKRYPTQLMRLTYLETLKWEVLPHSPYSPHIVQSDYYLLQSMAHGLTDQQFRSYEDIEKWFDS